ncbi:unnamed protein product, partial [Oppiella nova]
PGLILNERLKSITSPEELAATVKQIPLQSLGQPIDVANGVVYLASDDARYITGTNLAIGGGLNYIVLYDTNTIEIVVIPEDIHLIWDIACQRHCTPMLAILLCTSRSLCCRIIDPRARILGKVVLVTGSSSGIGEVTTKEFSRLGASVVITGRKATDISRVAQEVQQLSPYKLKPLEIVADLAKPEDVNRLVNETIKTFGKLDVLVNNAAVFYASAIDDKNLIEMFDRTMAVNLRAPLQLIQLAHPYLNATNGSIINIGAVRVPSIVVRSIPAGVSKAGLDYSVKVLALALGPRVRINAVDPGLILTEKLKSITSPEEIAAMAKQIPLQSMGQPIDVANGVVYLASDDARYITGTNLVIGGGITN